MRRGNSHSRGPVFFPFGGKGGRGEREERWETFWNSMFPKVIAYGSFMFPQSANVYVL